MHIIMILMLTFMGSVYGMDEKPISQQPKSTRDSLEAVRQDQGTLFPNITADLFPVIQGYNLEDYHQDLESYSQELQNYSQELQQKLDGAQSIEEIMELGRTDEHIKITLLQLKLSKTPIKIPSLELRLSKYANVVTDEIFEELTQLFPHVTILDLAYAKITQAGLEHIKDLTNLKELYLNGTSITNDGLKYLQGLPNLNILNLGGMLITDEGLEYLQSLPKLTTLYLYGHRIPKETIVNLRKGLPNCKIYVI